MVDYRTNMTDREHSVYKYICNCIENNGYPPTLREICTALDIKSPMTVSKCLDSLENMNLIVRKPNTFRGITLTKQKAKKDIPLYEDQTMARIGSVTLQDDTKPAAGSALLLKNGIIRLLKTNTP